MSLKDDQHRPPGSKWASVKDGWASTWWVERWGGRRGLLAAVTLAVLLFGLIFTVQDVLGWPSPANF